MKVLTKIFGEIELAEENIINFKEGIPGFEEHTQFILLQKGDNKFCYLQSITDEGIYFVVVSPYALMEDYNPKIPQGYFQKVGNNDISSLHVYVIASICHEIEKSTINMRGPIIINEEKKLGIQVMLEDDKYNIRESLVELTKRRG